MGHRSMKIFVILAVFLSSSFTISCGNKKDGIDRENSNNYQNIVDALNIEDSDKALALINEELQHGPDNLEIKYLKAQALSLKADVDVYSLFPIVKMKLFDVAMTEWHAMNEFSKKTKGGVSDTLIGQNKFKTLEDIDEAKKKIELMPDDDITYKLNFKDERVSRFSYPEYSKTGEKEKVNISCSVLLVIDSNIFNGLNTLQESLVTEASYIKGEQEEPSCTTLLQQLKDLYISNSGNFVKFRVKNQALLELEKKKENFKARKVTESYINAVYALYDSIGVIKKVPDIDQEKSAYIYEALAILKFVMQKTDKGSRLWKNSQQQIGLLAGYLILSSIKDSFDLEKVVEPTDFVCQVKPENVVKNYLNYLTGFRYLTSIILDTEFYTKNKKNVDQINDYLNEAPETLSDDQTNKIINACTDYAAESC